MKKGIFIALMIFGTICYFSLYILCVLVNQKYISYLLFGIGYLTIIVFPLGLFLYQKERRKTKNESKESRSSDI